MTRYEVRVLLTAAAPLTPRSSCLSRGVDDCNSKFLSEPLLPDGAAPLTNSLPPFLSRATAGFLARCPRPPLPAATHSLPPLPLLTVTLLCVRCLSVSRLFSRRLSSVQAASVSNRVRAVPLGRCPHCCCRHILRAHSAVSYYPRFIATSARSAFLSSSRFPSHSRQCLSPQLSSTPRRGVGSASGSGGLLSGLSTRLTSVVDSRRAAAADNKFSGMVSDMLAVGKYRLSDHVRFMEQTAADAGVSGWKSYMPGVSSQAGVEELRRMLAILNSFTPSEQSDVSQIGRESRLRAATATGRTVADVNFVLRQYSGAVLVHQWLHSRKARGLSLPATQSELSNMMAVDRPPQAQQLRHKPRRR